MSKRLEQIKQAAESKANELSSPYQAFVLGANWADMHPVNQWHKVEDELPPRIKETVNVSKAVLVTDGFSYGVAYYNYALNVWRSASFITITHWMPLAKLPQEE